MSFYNETEIKSVRKARKCNGCRTLIAVGSPALKCAGHHEGDFWSEVYHHECRSAEAELNRLHETQPDEWDSLGDHMEWEDWPWLMADFPIVAERMKITPARYEEAKAERERCYAAWTKVHAAQGRG